jgi:hypothetical protein
MMGCVYARGDKLWIRFRGPDGWTQQNTPFHLGDEQKARKLLLDVEAMVKAGLKFPSTRTPSGERPRATLATSSRS